MFYTELVETASHIGNAKTSKPTVLSISKYVAYPSITHAGGQYLQSHIEALETFAHVTQLAPDTPLNRGAMQQPGVASASLLSAARPKLHGLAFRLFQIESVFAGSSIYWPVRKLFRDDRGPWRDIEQADIVEFQWSEMIGLAPSVRQRFTEKPLVGIAHDVITQRWQRQAASADSFITRALARFAGARSRAREARSFAALDALLVFSEKDAQLARELAPSIRVEVVHPGLGPKPATRKTDSAQPIALFVGAMNRPENWKSALWFLEHVWPAVIREVPTARFVIAGANPPQQLIDTIAQTPHTELTGFVDDLKPYYEQATVCVVPLLAGAGVKFKTLDAMLYGVPVVSTRIGVEGIEADGLFAAVTDDAAEFVAATTQALQSPNERRANEAREWAERVYGEATFVAKITEVYDDILAK